VILKDVIMELLLVALRVVISILVLVALMFLVQNLFVAYHVVKVSKVVPNSAIMEIIQGASTA
jgi:hypothetical protein